MKPERAPIELTKAELNGKLAALVGKRNKFVAEARDKAPPKASSFDSRRRRIR